MGIQVASARDAGFRPGRAMIGAMTVDLRRYFERIGHEGPAGADLQTLRAIHVRHPAAIPFENLAAFTGEPVPLDVASLQRKLLIPGRGGWCFEHNLLLAAVLEALGFEVTRLAARVRWNVPPAVVTPRSHMLLMVSAGGERLVADVGFGGLTLTAPLRLEPGIEQPTPHEPHRLALEGNRYVLQAKLAGEWQALYAFDLARQEVEDYEVSNWYLCNNPASQFVKGLVCARADADRRHALRNTRYAVHFPDGRTERRFIGTVAELRDLLADVFRLDVPRSRVFGEKAAAMIAANPPEA
ncbi:MAG TPA: arylamine N-acetyltransferase [Usitatibacter sp.]|nr:arylamine N-acetyltransferase [Usitatibacter sp.]